MSRVGKASITVPAGVEFNLAGQAVTVKGAGGTLSLNINPLVSLKNEAGVLSLAPVDESREANAMSGTMRQLVNNMIIGVSKGFEKKLNLVGVGYKAAASGSKLNLAIGFSHPVDFDMPAGVKVATPTPTEIVLNGVDRQVLGQIAAEIRAVRPPEPYKGKGIRYSDEVVVIKETKKK
jgi:large subunit ribosomal protein L6